MNKKANARKLERKTDDLLPEYDFTKGVRGKHYEAYRKGHTVTVNKKEGGREVQHFTLADGAVMLETDVRKYFRDSEAVNKALRGLISLRPVKSSAKARS